MFGPYQQERVGNGLRPTKIRRSTQHCHLQYHPVGVGRIPIPRFYLASVMNGQEKQDGPFIPSLAQAFEAMVGGKLHAVMAPGRDSTGCSQSTPMRACD